MANRIDEYFTLPEDYTLVERSGDIVLGYNPKASSSRYGIWRADRFRVCRISQGHYCQKIQQAVRIFAAQLGEEEIA